MTALNQGDFIAFMVNHLEGLFGASSIKKIDEMTYEVADIDGDKDSSMQVYLGNVWNNYERTQDINTGLEFLNAQAKVIKQKASIVNDGVDLTRIYPVLRVVDFGLELSEKQKAMGSTAHMVSDDFSKELKIVYAQDNDAFVSFVMCKQLEDGLTEDILSEKAFENLKAQGWIEADEIIDVGDIARVHIFHESDKQYQGQFMVRDLYEKHLGKYFHFALPTRETAVALEFKVNPDEYMQVCLELDKRLKLMALDMYGSLPNPLSHVIHRMRAGDGVAVLG